MKLRRLINLPMFGLVVMSLVGQLGAQDGRQATGCADINWPALQPSDPAHLDAVELARDLADHGFTVMCIAPSKMTHMFGGQNGAAVYRTDRGGFDALFLPKSQDFDRLRIIEKQESARYLYSFAGHPRPWSANLMDASHRVYFIKHANRLVVAHDKELATRLESALARR